MSEWFDKGGFVNPPRSRLTKNTDGFMTVLDWYEQILALIEAFIAWLEAILGFSL